MNPNEIKKALENWIKNFDGTAVEMATLSGAFLYINQLEAEVERLQKSIELMKGAKCVYSYDGETLEYCTSSPCPISKTVDQIKSEAIKEFAEKLLEDCIPFPMIDTPHNLLTSKEKIDNLVKEMKK